MPLLDLIDQVAIVVVVVAEEVVEDSMIGAAVEVAEVVEAASMIVEAVEVVEVVVAGALTVVASGTLLDKRRPFKRMILPHKRTGRWFSDSCSRQSFELRSAP
jgi:hypothetical protein